MGCESMGGGGWWVGGDAWGRFALAMCSRVQLVVRWSGGLAWSDGRGCMLQGATRSRGTRSLSLVTQPANPSNHLNPGGIAFLLPHM